jgi:hypothetical protein
MCVACSRSSAAAFFRSSARFQLSSKHKSHRGAAAAAAHEDTAAAVRASACQRGMDAHTGPHTVRDGKAAGRGYTSHRKGREKARAWGETDTVVQGRLAPYFLCLFCSLECLVDLALRARLRAGGASAASLGAWPCCAREHPGRKSMGRRRHGTVHTGSRCRQVPALRRASSRCRATAPSASCRCSKCATRRR